MAVTALDWVIVAASLVGVLYVGWRATKRAQSAGGSAEEFFLSGRSMSWPVVGASIFASNIGTENFVGQAGSAAGSGMAVGLYEWTAVYLLLLLGWFFAPFYLRKRVTTIPEFFEGRFDPRARMVLTLISMLAYVLTKISGALYAGAVVLKVVAGLSLWESTPAIILATAAYTASGGLSAVMFTDTLQATLFTIGGLIGFAVAMTKVGGWGAMVGIFDKAHLPWFPHVIQPYYSPHYPWPGLLFGQTIGSLWYWAIDQEMVQRILACKGLNTAKSGVVMAGFLKILPMLVVVIPGLVARALFERCKLSQGQINANWCEADFDNPQSANKAYPLLVVREFPMGVVGIMISCFFAAEMSSLSSVFNSASTVLTNDVYRRFYNPQATERQLIWCGRLATAFMLAVSLLWLPVIDSQSDELYQLIQSAQTHIAPTLTTVFTLGLLWPRVNSIGAVVGLLVGVVFGMARLGVNFAYNEECREQVEHTPDGPRVGGPAFQCMNFNYFALVLAGTVAAVTAVASLLSHPPPREKVEGRVVDWQEVRQRVGSWWRKMREFSYFSKPSSLKLWAREKSAPWRQVELQELRPSRTEDENDDESAEGAQTQSGQWHEDSRRWRMVNNVLAFLLFALISSLIVALR